MKILGIIDTDFINYKLPSMTVMFPYCDLKCNRETGLNVCHNMDCLKASYIDITTERIIEMYRNDNITKALVLQGMEPFDSFHDVVELIVAFRKEFNDPVVIYTGYYEGEQREYIKALKEFPNIIIKFGRFIPGQRPHYDKVLGVELASDNQYAKEIS